MMRSIATLCVLLLALSIGCRKSSEKTTIESKDGTTTIEQTGDKTVVHGADGTKATIDKDGSKMQMETKDGKFTIGDNKVPEGFPLSLMPGSKVGHANHLTPTDGPETFQVMTETADDPKAVAAFYEKALKEKVLKFERFDSSSDQGTQVMLTARGDKVEVIISITKDAKAQKCDAIITWNKEK